MEGRDGRYDALVSRDRCLGAIPGEDFETQRSLWRAALRYQERVRREGVTGCSPSPLLTVRGNGAW